jgi:class 3 adenylate cyclase
VALTRRYGEFYNYAETGGAILSTRRFAAILAADVAGYSRLMGTDEEGTLAALKALRRELVDPKIKERHGRIGMRVGVLSTVPSLE